MHTLKLLLGPGVYIAWRGDEALYVGSAKNIMHRISHPKHGQLKLALAAATRIEFQYCVDEEECRREEWLKIIMLKPKYNRTGFNGNMRWADIPING
jgi:excinuclease UvrABC nuclease subunit